ncbi:hypothetical protein ED208_07220 [Stagnimonas aquatica]|uniref:TonB family protein n=1 Tax=Stagnimonas aquatica TaxID=2689987 RepID=A0A3N0VHA7_9GAMM|nr:hypothetical protein [Stagnimonas aquatica]ROH92149.1 hypothetical protein ED208_07220 [Stagnimonas aquatica]
MPSKNSRRLRWALLIALALHALLAWQYAGDLRARVAAALQPETVRETVVQLAPEPPLPPSKRWELATKLSSRSPEDLPPPLPDNFFPKPAPPGRGFLSLSTKLSGASLSAALTAAIVPEVVRLPDVEARGAPARTPRPARAARAAPPPASPLLAAATPEDAEELPLPLPQAPLRLPTQQDEAELDLAIRRAAEEAQRSARVELPSRTSPDLRGLLPPQGPLAPTPPPASRKPLVEPRPLPPAAPAGITTYPLDAPPAPEASASGAESGGDYTRNRAEYFARLTAQLKATNQRALAEAVKATPRMTVRMKFVVDRRGAVLDIYASETVPAEAARRAADIVRAAAPFPRIPESMVQPRLELSYPVEIYR